MKPTRNSKTNGFTLVETIVSIAIIGILAAAVVTTVLGKTQAIEAEHSANNTENAGLYSDNNTAPNPVDVQVLDINSTADDQSIQAAAQAASQRMELRIIQTAMDLMMISQELQTVIPTSGTSDMSNFPAGHPLYPRYVREASTQFKYQCDASGEVTQVLK